MCYEDIRIGYRRSAKYTPCITTTVQIPANKNRVVLRICCTTTAAGEVVGNAIPEQFGSSAINVLYVNQGKPSDEIWFERHGSAVQGAFTISSSGNVLITEIIDNDLPNALMQGDPIEQGKFTAYR